jgi:hypothetical protein
MEQETVIINKSDEYYLDFINSSLKLRDVTKKQYIKNLETIKTKVWNEPTSIEYIINNPNEFCTRLDKYAKETKGIFSDSISNNTKKHYCSNIVALFYHNEQLLKNKSDLYNNWI